MTDKQDDTGYFSMNKIVGVIYPIPLQFVSRIFNEQRDVFVKYVAHPTSVRLVSGDRVLFYVSQGPKEVVGEAKIQEIELLTPMEALEKHGGRLFLNRDELMKYTFQQPSRTLSKKMLVLVLSMPRKYAKGVRYGSITMAGEYLTKENYDTLIQKAKE